MKTIVAVALGLAIGSGATFFVINKSEPPWKGSFRGQVAVFGVYASPQAIREVVMINEASSSRWSGAYKWLCATVLTVQVIMTSVSACAANSDVLPMQRRPPLAQRLTLAALTAPSSVQQDGSLYGMQRWNAATRASYFGMQFPGLLSCAYTVSAIFSVASHPIGNLAAVSSVDAALTGWPKITELNDLKPGDVVFWRPRHMGVLRCPNTHWHVGIAVGDGQTVDNDWWSGKPEMHSVSRLCSTFAYARRAPK